MQSKETVLITLDYLDKHKTKNGGYTKLQAEALGCKWPLIKGWKKWLIGSKMHYEDALIFESDNAKQPNKKQVREVLTIDNCIAYLSKNVNSLQDWHLKQIKYLLNKKGITDERVKSWE